MGTILTVVVLALVVALVLVGRGGLWHWISPGRRRVMAHGERGEAVVLESRRSEAKGGTSFYDLKLRAHFGDGTTAEFSTSEQGADVGMVRVGDTLPIRYDPAHRSRIAVDVPAIEAARQDANQQAIARAESKLD